MGFTTKDGREEQMTKKQATKKMTNQGIEYQAFAEAQNELNSILEAKTLELVGLDGCQHKQQRVIKLPNGRCYQICCEKACDQRLFIR